jgi:3'-phosphoadenosine 5'-phosphosulfate (PAPS) 3'-phosphatase
LRTEKLIDDMQYLLRDVGTVLKKMQARGVVDGLWQGTQFKSEADLLAAHMLSKGLALLTPGIHIVSEEDVTTHSKARPSRYWIIDPIDGTASFCGGFSGYVTQMALMEAGRPALGGVYAPSLDLMYVAEKASGSTVNGDRLAVKTDDTNLMLTDNYPKPQGIAKLIYEKLQCVGYLESGSIGLKICRVADGNADIFVKDVVFRDWDISPGHLVLLEAGGLLTDLNGCQIAYQDDYEKSGGMIAASSKRVIDAVVAVRARCGM